MDAGRESGRRLPHSKTLREFRGAVSARQKGAECHLARRLYLSHATKVVVVDLEKNAIVGEIADTPGVHAFVAAPEVQRGFSTNGKEAKVSVVDLKTLATISKVDTGEGPDAIVYDAKR